ncbi:MAG: 30S ribosomal protein S6 [Puniceicoccales bacterium]|jgi:small subunit ribosomal protein S6|nr:30S ribosomal protein S6 [Puniceicoccales bacterium]
MSDIRKYAASFILDMRGCMDSVDTLVEQLSKMIADFGGKIAAVENLGQKNFERVVNKSFTSGIYVQFLFEGAPSIVEGIKSKLKLDKTINRILIESIK